MEEDDLLDSLTFKSLVIFHTLKCHGGNLPPKLLSCFSGSEAIFKIQVSVLVWRNLLEQLMNE